MGESVDGIRDITRTSVRANQGFMVSGRGDSRTVFSVVLLIHLGGV